MCLMSKFRHFQAEKAAAREKAAREKLEKGKMSPDQMFRNEQYSAWNEQGLPTHDAKGNEVSCVIIILRQFYNEKEVFLYYRVARYILYQVEREETVTSRSTCHKMYLATLLVLFIIKHY